MVPRVFSSLIVNPNIIYCKTKSDYFKKRSNILQSGALITFTNSALNIRITGTIDKLSDLHNLNCLAIRLIY